MEVGCSQFFKSRWNSGSLDPDIEVDIESVQTEGPQESVNVENMFRADSSIQVGAGINRVYQKNAFRMFQVLIIGYSPTNPKNFFNI